MALLGGPSFLPRTGKAPGQLVILLHGVGADGRALIELAPLLSEHLPNAAFYAPDAPFPCDMAPYGRQWFSLQDRRPESLLRGVRTVAPMLDQFIALLLDRHGLDERRLALVGFSQGTMLSLYAAPRRAKPLAAVLGFSGALIGAAELAGETRSPPEPVEGRAGRNGGRKGGRCAGAAQAAYAPGRPAAGGGTRHAVRRPCRA